ncbi:hypothetical protein CCACVL1_18336, partial [Corchorus capsularis]
LTGSAHFSESQHTLNPDDG